MSRFETWRNSVTGEIYTIEYGDAEPSPEPSPRPAQLPETAVIPYEEAVRDVPARSTALDPRRARLLAKIIRSALEGSDDAA